MINAKNVIASVAVATISAAALTTGSASALTNDVAQEPATTANVVAACTQDASAIVINNTDELFVAPVDAEWTGVTQIGPIATSIPAGAYTIDYTSYDDHSASADENGVNNEGQTQEQWFIQGLFEGNVVYTSAGTVDLPENVDTITGLFGENVELPAIDAVMLHHVLAVDEDGRFPQSVAPSCVGFTPIVEEVVVVEEEPEVLAAVVEEEEAPTLADTGISSVLTMATGVALVGGAGIVSRKQ